MNPTYCNKWNSIIFLSISIVFSKCYSWALNNDPHVHLKINHEWCFGIYQSSNNACVSFILFFKKILSLISRKRLVGTCRHGYELCARVSTCHSSNGIHVMLSTIGIPKKRKPRYHTHQTPDEINLMVMKTPHDSLDPPHRTPISPRRTMYISYKLPKYCLCLTTSLYTLYIYVISILLLT